MSEEGNIQKTLRSGRKVPESNENMERKSNDRSSKKSNDSDRHNSEKTRTSMIRKQKLENELQAIKELNEIEDKQAELHRQKLERERNRIRLELELKTFQLDNEESEKDETEISKTDYIKDWISNIKATTSDNEHENAKSSRNPTKNNNDKVNFLEKIVTRQSLNKDLPYFGGNPIEWPNFIAQFRETTALCQFSNRENVSRLQKCLKGKARETVDALLNFPDEIDRILNLLEKRFGKTEDILDKVFNQITYMKPIREENMANLIELSNCVHNTTVVLNSLDCSEYLINPQIIRELVEKLPINLKLQWGKYAKNLNKKTISIENFATWLEEFTEEFSYVHSSIERREKKQRHILTMKNSTIPKFSCILCKKEKHQLSLCEDFNKMIPDNRWKFVVQHKLCFSCLTPRHQTNKCKKKQLCTVDGCQKYHHKLLHTFDEIVAEVKCENDELICHTSQNIENRNLAILKVVPVELEGPGGMIETYALCDEGSTITVVEESVANTLQCQGTTDPLVMKWTNDTTKTEENSRRVTLKIRGKFSRKTFSIMNARTIKDLRLPVQTIDVKELKKHYEFLKNIDIENLQNAKSTILIGQDNWPLIVGREICYESWNGPAVSRTCLGWILHGNLPMKNQVDDYTFHLIEEKNSDDALHNLVEKHFFQDFGEIYPEKNPQNQNENIEIMENIEKNEEHKWEVGLLWKKHVYLPESYTNAARRLRYIEKKMDKDEKFAEAYSNAVDAFLEKGYARKLSNHENTTNSDRTWYLPHFPVYNQNKPGKTRVVFDAAAKSNEISLNDNLLVGPDYFNSLPGILMKFRQKKIGFSSDIKEMFLQIKVKAEDRQAQRFLWRGRKRNTEVEVYEMTTLIFGAACSPCLAQAVKNKNALQFEEKYPDSTKAIRENFYMDDYLDTEDNEEEAIKRIREVIEIHKNGGFQICNWICSSQKVFDQIPDELKSTKNRTLSDVFMLPTEKVLGLWWDAHSDDFKFEFQLQKINSDILNEKKIPTKREVLRISMQIFDPLGFAINIMVHVRILLQDIWKENIPWDEKLPSTLQKDWFKWLRAVKTLKDLKIPRYYFGTVVSSVQLHIFCDSSERVYGTVAYFRYRVEGILKTVFVTAKARVAPLKTLSVPRLELMAAVLGARLDLIIKNKHSIPIEKTYHWSDSKTVILWLRADTKKYKQFVAFRVEDILGKTKKESWKWVDTKNNVADRLTKWSRENNAVWFNGPDFLRKEESFWPKENFEQNERSNLEIKKKYMFIGVVEEEKKELPDLKRFSKWQRLIRSTAWFLRFIRNCKISISKLQEEKSTTELYPEELLRAEKLWLVKIQREMFEEDYEKLKKNKEVGKHSKIYRLVPYLDNEGIMRMKGRLKHVPDMDENQKNPIILNEKHRFTELLLEFYHQKFMHQGLETVINEIRMKYWITHSRSAVKNAFRKCLFCKNRKSTPAVPEMGNLPLPRVSGFVRPFTNCGVDYFGPMNVRIGGRSEKRYGVLFTCMAMRAVHLELAHSLDTDSAILAIKRMVSRRGCPVNLYSDNGTNFRATDKEIRKAIQELDQNIITKEMTMKNIKWHFLPPASPNFGGAWERLIKTVKHALKVVLKETCPKEETLGTILCEVEFTVNSRPLTQVPIEPDDLECLTPNHFLIGRSCGSSALDIVKPNLRSQWQLSQKLADQFWNRWLKEYLPTLNERKKWFQNPKNLKIDDLVVIADSNGPRNSWPKGRITAVHPGSDGKVRVADVQTSVGVFRRPVSKLCPIGVVE